MTFKSRCRLQNLNQNSNPNPKQASSSTSASVQMWRRACKPLITSKTSCSTLKRVVIGSLFARQKSQRERKMCLNRNSNHQSTRCTLLENNTRNSKIQLQPKRYSFPDLPCRTSKFNHNQTTLRLPNTKLMGCLKRISRADPNQT